MKFKNMRLLYTTLSNLKTEHLVPADCPSTPYIERKERKEN
jgi:hypothetical protein